MRWPLLLVALAAAPAAGQTLAIVNAEAWTAGSPAPVDDATILIDGARIVSVEPDGGVPEGTPVIDAAGQPVTAGLVNAATQIGLTEVSSATDTRDTAAQADLGANFDVSRALNGNSVLVDLARSDGVTRAVVYPAKSDQPPFSGQPALVRLRDGADILDRSQIAVHVVIGGGEWDKLGSRAAQWQMLRKALDRARGERDKSDRDDDRRRRSRGRSGDALEAVLSGDIPLAIETHRESDVVQAIALARDYGIRLIVVGGAEAWRAADELAAARIPVVLDPQANLPTSFDQLGARLDNAALLAKAGVTIAFGIVGGSIHYNYNAGLALREGAGIAVANGLPYVDALRAVTVNPLAIWGAAGGSLSAGADADLVIWDGDPLEPSTNALHVIVEGVAVSVETRQNALARRYLDGAP